MKGREILYIGKATSLRSRVRSYFATDLIHTRGSHIVDMVFKATTVKYEVTDSVLEALILEANLIKKHQPKYNTKEKDDKSFNYVVITDETIPKVLLIRGREVDIKMKTKTMAIRSLFGPYPSGGAIRDGLKIIRRIFPFVDQNSIKKR
jgi:excinuclease ABC subunit C